MAKKHPPSEPQGDLHLTLYEVRLVCAVPDYGVGESSALDYILSGNIDEINIIDSDETTLRVMRNSDESDTVPARQHATTLGEDEDSLVQAIATSATATKPTKRKRRKTTSAEVDERNRCVHAALRALVEASASDLATVTAIPIKQVYKCLYTMHDAKQIGAVKNDGRVTWLSLKQ
jgi:hypothetical protein